MLPKYLADTSRRALQRLTIGDLCLVVPSEEMLFVASSANLQPSSQPNRGVLHYADKEFEVHCLNAQLKLAACNSSSGRFCLGLLASGQVLVLVVDALSPLNSHAKLQRLPPLMAVSPALDGGFYYDGLLHLQTTAAKLRAYIAAQRELEELIDEI